MNESIQLEPDTDEILQVEEEPAPMVPIPVVVTGPTRVQELPRKSWRGRTIIALGTTPKRILAADPHRALVELYAWTDAILIAPTQFSFGDDTYTTQEDGSAVKWPQAVVRAIHATGEVWARAATTTTDLSVYVENWADGC